MRDGRVASATVEWLMRLPQASLTRRGPRDRTFRGLKPTAKISRRYRGEDLPRMLQYRPRTVRAFFTERWIIGIFMGGG
jgi:hypothetical protein